MFENANVWEILAFALYFLFVIAIGIYFFIKTKSGGQREYFLGGRKMGKWTTAFSAQASDMSGWLLMGLPGSILVAGFGKVWIAIGLAIGTYLAWLFVAGRLRAFSQAANDSITIPQYINNRFKSSGLTLQVISALIFFVCFTVYVASGFKAGATLFASVLNLDSTTGPMLVFGAIIILYTFLGGYNAVCWTDLFQALLMIIAMVIVPVVIFVTREISFEAVTASNPHYFNFLASGKWDWESISTILSGLAWGLGYCGMPHILVRYMSIKDVKMIKSSRRIATAWVVISLLMAAVIAILGRIVMPELAVSGSETVFIQLSRAVFPSFIAGILLSAILASSMSTADSQLLVASSAVTSDIYQPIFRKNASDRELLWIGRIAVIIISIVAFFIASNPNSGSIMDLVENAWAGFGAAFGPVIVLSLYWKRFTYKGAVATIVCGAITVIVWLLFFKTVTGIYELLPGFIVGMLAGVIVSLIDKKPSEEVEQLFDDALKMCKE